MRPVNKSKFEVKLMRLCIEGMEKRLYPEFRLRVQHFLTQVIPSNWVNGLMGLISFILPSITTDYATDKVNKSPLKNLALNQPWAYSC